MPARNHKNRFEDEVLDLSHKKLVRGGTEEAIERFERLLERSGEAVAPWPQLAAYRLAMLYLRRGAGADLARADALLSQAAECGALGPLPRLYLMAVLHRRRLSVKGSERATLDDRIDLVFQISREQLAQRRGPGRDELDPRLQDGVFNMLELAGLFLGRDLSDLEGRDGPFADLGLIAPTHFRIYDSGDPSRRDLRYPYTLAVCEVEALAERDPELVLVRDDPKGGGQRHYRLPGQRGWTRATDSPPWEVLLWALTGLRRETSSEAERQTMRRARRWFEDHLGHELIEGSASEPTLAPSPRVLFVTFVSRPRT